MSVNKEKPRTWRTSEYKKTKNRNFAISLILKFDLEAFKVD